MDLLVERDNQQPNFGDMLFVNGVAPVTENFTESVAQRVFITLRTFEGEWYLNTTVGVPYLERILGQKVEKSVVDRILQEKILGVDGVADIVSFTSQFLPKRGYECKFTLRTTEGGTFADTFSVIS